MNNALKHLSTKFKNKPRSVAKNDKDHVRITKYDKINTLALLKIVLLTGEIDETGQILEDDRHQK